MCGADLFGDAVLRGALQLEDVCGVRVLVDHRVLLPHNGAQDLVSLGRWAAQRKQLPYISRSAQGRDAIRQDKGWGEGQTIHAIRTYLDTNSSWSVKLRMACTH